MVSVIASKRLKIASDFEADDDVCLKAIQCELNTISRSDGSVTLSQNNNTVIAYVNGPIEIKMQYTEIDRGAVQLNFRPKSGQMNANDRLLENQLKSILESAILLNLYPQSGIQIALQEIENRGSLLATLINGVCLALILTGIEMHFTFAAVTAAISIENDIILDPDQVQIDNAKGLFVFVFNSVDEKLIFCHTIGIFSKMVFFQAKNQCRSQIKNVFNYFRKVAQSLSNHI